MGETAADVSRYAGFWIRVLPWLIDILIIVLPLGAIYSALGLHHGTGLTHTGSGNSSNYSVGLYVRGPADLLTVVVAWLYYAFQESSSAQATLGKRLFGLRVTDAEGGRISFARASGRYFAKFVSGVVLLIGYFMAGWTAREQGLHDLIARTLVVRGRAETAAVPAEPHHPLR